MTNMRRWMAGGVATAMIMVAACGESPSEPLISANDDDYALVAFGQAGAALEGTLGTQGERPFDGRTCGPQLPAELQLTEAQRAEIAALREAFKAGHQTQLDALRAIFAQARAAREAGATRAEVHVILEQGRPIIQALRPDVQALHAAIRAVFTAEQAAWLDSHRRRMPLGMRAPRR